MLAIQQVKKAPACTPNILPCKVHHNGKVNASQRHWDPQTSADGGEQAYFRGRKLLGHTVELPKGSQGVVLEKGGRILPQTTKKSPSSDELEDDDEDEEESDVQILDQVASFDRFTVWGHEAAPTGADDPYIKSMAEWIAFAQAMNGYDEDPK